MEKLFLIATVLGSMVTVALLGVQIIWKNDSEKPQNDRASTIHPLSK